MNEQLIIRLPSDPQTPVAWLIWSPLQGLVASGEIPNSQGLSQLTEKAQDRAVLVFVSTLSVGLHVVHLPAKSKRHLRQVVPFALEDELAEDIEELHFAWADGGSKNDQLPVAVVSRAKMAQWISALTEAQLPTSHVYPDIYLLPSSEQTWSTMCFGSEWILRTGAWEGFAFDITMQAHVTCDAHLPAPSAIHAFGEFAWDSAPAPIVAQEPLLPLQLAAQLATDTCINLMQGDYRVQESSRIDLSKYRFPAIAASFFVAVLLLSKWTTALELERDTRMLAQETERVYLQTFPNEVRVQDPVMQMEQQVRALAGGQQGHVLEILQKLEPAFAAAPLQLTMLQYDASRGELRLQANGVNFQSFERFTQAARAQDLDVSQGQLTSRGGQINGTILVRRSS